MATTKSRSRPASQNGGPASIGEAVKDAGATLADTTRRSRRPLIAAGAAAAGLVGGLALGSRGPARRRPLLSPRRRVLGVPVGPKSSLLRAAELLSEGARRIDSATGQVAATGEEMRQVREQLEKVNRRSPVEVVLDGLTHRRGVHRD